MLWNNGFLNPCYTTTSSCWVQCVLLFVQAIHTWDHYCENLVHSLKIHLFPFKFSGTSVALKIFLVGWSVQVGGLCSLGRSSISRWFEILVGCADVYCFSRFSCSVYDNSSKIMIDAHSAFFTIALGMCRGECLARLQVYGSLNSIPADCWKLICFVIPLYFWNIYHSFQYGRSFSLLFVGKWAFDIPAQML